MKYKIVPSLRLNNHGQGCSNHSNSLLDSTTETIEDSILMVKILDNYIA